MKLTELASVIRSKNAGPATLTFDIFFRDAAGFAQAIESPALAIEAIASLYGCAPAMVTRHALPAILALKISLPRKIVAGTPGDGDVYGAQQHGPLLQVEL